MRFKKLRIVLGISIVLFILVVANVLIFGSSKISSAIIPNKNSGSTALKVLENSNPTPVQTNSAPAQVVQSPPQIYYPPIRTRAS